MLELFFLIYLGYKNHNRAKAYGLNGMLWAALTTVAFIVAYVIGMFFIVFFFLRNKFAIDANANTEQLQELAKNLTQEFVANPLYLFTVYFFGVGGYLFVRFLIDQKGDKNDVKPIHWMDKLNNNSHES